MWSPVQVLGNRLELLQRRAEVLDDFGGDDGGVGEVVGVLQRIVLEPEDVEAGLVAGDQLVVVV